MNKKEKNETDNEFQATFRMEEPKQFEVWWSWWHWALPVLIGWIPEVKRFYIQIFALNIAIGFRAEGR